MNTRTFLIQGLLAGLLAGVAAFFVAYTVGEPQVDTAISLEESAAADEAPAESEAAHTHDDADAHTHSHGEEEGTTISRDDQSTWGLLTGSVVVALAIGGVLGIISAGVAGRIGRLTLRQSTALVVALGFVAFALVPFLKYPATPPAVGDGETIGHRTAVYFGFLLVSLIAAVAITALAAQLRPRFGAYAVVVGGVLAYLVVMVVAGNIFPTVNEIGDFPADTLWYFRLSSLYTLVALWGVLGIVLTGLVGRTQQKLVHDNPVREPVTAA